VTVAFFGQAAAVADGAATKVDSDTAETRANWGLKE